uniref:Uncharacterized protein n=1 Tax=Anguilla anguilla TaxID=7936 RepID=A0A0E9V7Z2_ANGAN
MAGLEFASLNNDYRQCFECVSNL